MVRGALAWCGARSRLGEGGCLLKEVCWWLLGGENGQVWVGAMVEKVERSRWLWWMRLCLVEEGDG